MSRATEILEKLGKKAKEELVGAAMKIAYEYPYWGSSEVYDTYQTYKAQGRKVPFDMDMLYDMTDKASALKDQLVKWRAAEATLMKEKI